MNLADLKVRPHFRGFMHVDLFDNGYGISVIPELDGEHYEVAVLEHAKGHKAHLTYDTVITDDVIRYCTVNAVDTLIERIRNLAPREVAVGPIRQKGAVNRPLLLARNV
jgi:hypothetical protein